MNAIKWMGAVLALAVLTACSEQPQVVEYKAGTYSGKPDTRPYDSAMYQGDKATYESDMRARTHKQTEIGRMAK
ncbi:hypothetical protein G3580_00970 [Nitrogeniibacter mangrovi]|uniref:Lipoprotein n=1 Tax=Nitrogeniibacter mangrovi TaxID=2016596 RepID=A0A6C1B1V0_9RHOO|nr:hypothetical protein [Nitrogeniibacter mangrovi]QID16320.1 hypothetical protein G3580_00970 [Nitrogeniibacter mangrovi]